MKMYQLYDTIQQTYDHACSRLRWWFWNLDLGEVGSTLSVIFCIFLIILLIKYFKNAAEDFLHERNLKKKEGRDES